jgi:hypothetical protein
MVYISRLAMSLTVAFLSCGDLALGQSFSSHANYRKFYNSMSALKINSVSEPTIALSWIFERFNESDQSWEKLRNYLKRHKQLYPESEESSVVAEHLEVVERMLDEKRPSKEMKVERMIYDLREINKRQPSQSQIFIDKGPEEKFGDCSAPPNAAKELRDFGYDAIPVLIEHIHDDTLTRRVEYSKFSQYHVLTVGECCRHIIDEMLPSARQFSFESDPNASKEDMMEWYDQLIAEKKAELSHTAESAVGPDLKAQSSSRSR